MFTLLADAAGALGGVVPGGAVEGEPPPGGAAPVGLVAAAVLPPVVFCSMVGRNTYGQKESSGITMGNALA